MNRGSQGFTLVEMIVALGLSIIIMVMIARVFVTCAGVADIALTSSSFYLKLGHANYWLNEEFIQPETGALPLDYADRWCAVPTDIDDVNNISLKDMPDGEGVLLDIANSYSAKHIEAASSAYVYVTSELYRFNFSLYFTSRPDHVQFDGPDATPTVPIRIFCNKWLLDSAGAE